MIKPEIAGENPWCAGKSVTHIDKILPISQVVKDLISNSSIFSLES